MPFDSFMTAALTKELSDSLVGLKVDRICQPERDEIDLVFNLRGRNRLVINCTASTPYVALSQYPRENPSVPPMMCMLLRKHLSRAKICSVTQLGFDRIITFTFDSGDEMGYRKPKYLHCEMMGRGANLIFVDDNGKILAAFRQNDLTTKFDRVVMVGMDYHPMPLPDKVNPMSCGREDFLEILSRQGLDSRLDLVLQKCFIGFGKLTAREIVFRAYGDSEACRSDMPTEPLWRSFSEVVSLIREGKFSPCLIYESEEAFLNSESPIDFSFMKITQFLPPFFVVLCDSVSEAVERFYHQRNAKERQKQHYNDIARILKNCKSRLEKKIALQYSQMADADDADEKRKMGDLITQEIYRIRKGDAFVDAMDYESGETVRIPLDTRFTPSQNAQQYYKEYNKKKNAALKMEEQIQIAKSELFYAESIEASLQTATAAKDLEEIREELSHWNYGRRLTSGLKKPHAKKSRAKPLSGVTGGGFTYYVGLNNLQNDTVTTSLGEKDDMWFHVKNYHGSHVLLKKREDLPFGESDLEEAASLAAFYSEVSSSDKVEVDYTKIKYVKKPNGSKPGFVTYKNHNTALVRPKKKN